MYLQFSPAAHHAHVKTTTGGPVVGPLLAGGDDASVALPLIVSTALLGGDGHSDPLAVSAYAGVTTPFLLLRLESEVLVQLADSRVTPSHPRGIRHSRSISTSPVASQWSEDLVIPTSGDRDDCNGVIPVDGKGKRPGVGVPCFCG